MPNDRSRALQEAPGLKQGIEVRQDNTTRHLSVFFSLLISLLAAGLWLGTFSKQEAVRGYVSVQGGVIRITSPGHGTVQSILVKQGDSVQKGQTLVIVKAPDIAADKQTTRAVEQRNLSQRQQNLTSEIGKIDEFIAQLRSDRQRVLEAHRDLVDVLDGQETELRKAVQETAAYVAKLLPLLASNDITRDRFLVHERALRDYRNKLSDVLAQRAQSTRDHTDRMASLDATLTAKSNQRASFANELASIDTQLNESRASEAFSIVATADGIIASIPVSIGSTVEQDQVLSVLGDPDGEQIIVLEAPSKAMGLVKPGQRVVLKYDAFPYKTFGINHGTVVSVPRASVDQPAQGVLTMVPASLADRQKQTSFNLLVKPDSNMIVAYGEPRPVALGSTLTADITIERRRLIDWVLDPIRAMQGRS